MECVLHRMRLQLLAMCMPNMTCVLEAQLAVISEGMNIPVLPPAREPKQSSTTPPFLRMIINDETDADTSRPVCLMETRFRQYVLKATAHGR